MQGSDLELKDKVLFDNDCHEGQHCFEVVAEVYRFHNLGADGGFSCFLEWKM